VNDELHKKIREYAIATKVGNICPHMKVWGKFGNDLNLTHLHQLNYL
jgi:hypothetical protein